MSKSANPECIRIENLHKSFITGKNLVPALRGIDLTIQKGEFVAVMGPSGCGKTTLLNLIAGLDQPDRGSIYIDGEELSKLEEFKMAALRSRKIGIVFQFYNLFPLLSALENVMTPMEFVGIEQKNAMQKAMKLLDSVGLRDRYNHRPDELSGGEQQRVAIARAFANNPTVILLDEPTGDLDSKNGSEIMELLQKFNKEGSTILVVTHDYKVAQYCSRIIHINDGKLASQDFAYDPKILKTYPTELLLSEIKARGKDTH